MYVCKNGMQHDYTLQNDDIVSFPQTTDRRQQDAIYQKRVSTNVCTNW